MNIIPWRVDLNMDEKGKMNGPKSPNWTVFGHKSGRSSEMKQDGPEIQK